MKVVYVAGPFRGPDAWRIETNIRWAEVYGMEVAQLGAMPLIPHANTRFFHGTLTDAFWLDGTLELLRRSDAVYLVRGWKDSEGAKAEADEARRLGKPVFEHRADLALWLSGGAP